MGLGSDYLMMITSAVRFRQIHLVCAGNERRAYHFAHKLAVSFPTPNRLEMESILFSLKAVTVLKSRCLFARHFFGNFLVHNVWSREKKNDVTTDGRFCFPLLCRGVFQFHRFTYWSHYRSSKSSSHFVPLQTLLDIFSWSLLPYPSPLFRPPFQFSGQFPS